MRHGFLTGMAMLFAMPAAAHDNAATTSSESPQDEPVPAQRRAYELSTRTNPYGITPHKANFLLPLSYSRRPSGRGLDASAEDLDALEIKFQLSFKVAVWTDPLELPVDLYFAYTGRSFWQAYNSGLSAPFWDTNHEPEVFFQTHTDWRLGPVSNINLRLGFNHQSNGQAVPLSRSWNRVYLGVNGRWDRFFADAVIWHRLPEDPKTDPLQAEGDDNPHIERTVGQAEFTLAWVIDRKTINLSWRNNLRRDNKGALTGAFTFPLSHKLKGYLELYSGYGETLIDYDRSNERLSLGIALSDWP